MMKLLLSGIPGTGKTTVADYLAAQHGYEHTDMEAGNFAARTLLRAAPEAFLRALPGNALLSWGFGPYEDRPSVEKILAAGFAFAWLDGDHTVSLRHFLARESGSPYQEAAYYGQMQMILATEVVSRTRPVVVNPYKGAGFRPVAEIAAEIIRRTERPAFSTFSRATGIRRPQS